MSINQTSIIFGGTRGIGKVIAEVLKKRGDNVIVASRTKKNSKKNLFIDLSLSKDVLKKTIIAYLKLYKIKKINNIVFCQRYRGTNTLKEFDVTVHSSYQIIEIIKKYLANFGSIVFISSITIKTIIDDQPITYHLSRSAIDTMSKHFAIELGGKGITSNCILPTKIIKPENKKFYFRKNNKITKMMKKITPLKRMGEAKEVAYLVDFLTSEKSRYITGCTIPIDGGTHIQSQESIAKKFF